MRSSSEWVRDGLDAIEALINNSAHLSACRHHGFAGRDPFTIINPQTVPLEWHSPLTPMPCHLTLPGLIVRSALLRTGVILKHCHLKDAQIHL